MDLKQRYGAVLYVDEAHAVGVRGTQGLGLAEEQGLTGNVDILIGTFGKALASAGAYAIVAPPVRDYLVNTARSLIFTTAMPPVTVWWTIFVLRRALDASDRRSAIERVYSRLSAGFGLARRPDRTSCRWWWVRIPRRRSSRSDCASGAIGSPRSVRRLYRKGPRDYDSR